VKVLASTCWSGIPHSLLGMPSDTDPKVKNLTKFLQRIPYVPFTAMASWTPDTSTTMSHFSTGSNVFHLLRYASRAARQSARDAFVRGLCCNPAPKRSIWYWIEGDACMRSRKAWLTFRDNFCAQRMHRSERFPRRFSPTTTGGCPERK